MPFPCKVKNCRTKAKQGITLFRAPIDDDKRKQWSSILRVDLRRNSFVCEKHFEKSKIKRAIEKRDVNGRIILEVALTKKTLLPGALPISSDTDRTESENDPCIDVTSINESNKEITGQLQKENMEIDDINTEKSSYHDDVLVPFSTDSTNDTNCSPSIDILPIDSQNVSGIDMTQVETPRGIKRCQNDENALAKKRTRLDFAAHLPTLDHSAVIAEHSYYSTGLPDAYLNLVADLLTGEENVATPPSWFCERDFTNESVIYFCCIVPKVDSSSAEIKLFVTKQVIFSKKGIVLWFNDKMRKDPVLLSKTYPTSQQEIEFMLNKIDTWNICAGGPNLEKSPKLDNVKLKKIVIDGNQWRHADCEVIVENAPICAHCVKITLRLQEAVTRLNQKAKAAFPKVVECADLKQKIQKRQRLDINVTPRSKKNFQKLKNKLTSKSSRLARKEKLIYELEEKIREIGSKDEKTIDDFLEKNGVPKAQVNVVKEIIKISKVKSKHGVRYSHSWLLTCLILYMRGPAVYRLLRSTNTLPLPCKSTIARYLKSSKAAPGFCPQFFLNFQRSLAEISAVIPGSENGILTFDEMQVKTDIGVNYRTMTFDGLVDYGDSVQLENQGDKSLKDRQADHALVFMFSSLKAAFHQPIAFFATRGACPSLILAKLILTAIIQLEKHGAKVQALVCDGAQTNRGLWKQFGLKAKAAQQVVCSFPNPFEPDGPRRVNFISDVPHLFKCVRNKLYSSGVFEISGKQIKWQYYREIYYADKNLGTGDRVCPRLREEHIEPKIMLKMRVSLAVQIFSHSVATGLRRYMIDPKFSEKLSGCEATITFTEKMNDLFDLLNANMKSKAIRPNNSCEIFEKLQQTISWLDAWETERDRKIAALKCNLRSDIRQKRNANQKQKKSSVKSNVTDGGNTSIDTIVKLKQKNCNDSIKRLKKLYLSDSTFQGLRMTLHSTIQLSQRLLEEEAFEYVLTRKFNQDPLEKFFGNIRQCGGQNDHPSIIAFGNLYSLLSAYSILRPPKFGNVSVDDNFEETKLAEDFDFFQKTNQPKYQHSYKKFHLEKLQHIIKNLVKVEPWETEGVSDLGAELSTSVTDNLIYCNTGYVCRKMIGMRQIQKCATCRQAFQSVEENSIFPVAQLLDIRSKGFLIYPHLKLFRMIHAVHNIIMPKMRAGDNAFETVINAFANNNIQLTFPCEEHKVETLSTALLHYVWTKLWHFKKDLQKEQPLQSALCKKEAKMKTS